MEQVGNLLYTFPEETKMQNSGRTRFLRAAVRVSNGAPSAVIASSLLLALLTINPWVATHSQSSGLQSSDLYQLRSAGDVRSSPDGSRIAYGVTNNDQPGAPYSQLWLKDVATGKTTRVEGASGGARWSPDGKLIACSGRAGDKSGQSGLILVRADGSQPTFIAPVQNTNHPLPSTGERIAWSPDNKQIAFISATPGPETESATGDPMVITRYLYKPTASEGMTRFNDNRRTHIFIADIETKQVRQLTDGHYYEHSIDCWSPDGKMIVYQGTKRGLTSSETTMEDTHVWTMNADGANRREIGGAIDNRQGSPEWSEDGASVYFTVQERGAVRLYRLPMNSSKPEVVINDRGSVGSWSVARNGLVAYSFAAPRDLAQLYLRANGATKQLTNLNQATLGSRQIAEVESFTFQSFDGLEIEAFLTSPLGMTANSKHPMITVIHGGPHGQQSPTFNSKAQVYAARGWAVLMVNFRGSTGYGQKFASVIAISTERHCGRWGERLFQPAFRIFKLFSELLQNARRARQI